MKEAGLGNKQGLGLDGHQWSAIGWSGMDGKRFMWEFWLMNDNEEAKCEY